jgi:hypothetical protein
VIKRRPAGSDSQSAFEEKECVKRERRTKQVEAVLRMKYLGMQAGGEVAMQLSFWGRGCLRSLRIRMQLCVSMSYTCEV